MKDFWCPGFRTLWQMLGILELDAHSFQVLHRPVTVCLPSKSSSSADLAEDNSLEARRTTSPTCGPRLTALCISSIAQREADEGRKIHQVKGTEWLQDHGGESADGCPAFSHFGRTGTGRQSGSWAQSQQLISTCIPHTCSSKTALPARGLVFKHTSPWGHFMFTTSTVSPPHLHLR